MRKRALFGMLVVGGILGLLVAAFTASAVHYTGTNAFCGSCHEMERIFVHYRTTKHYNNELGIRAGCSDCHLPHDDWAALLIRKTEAGLHDVISKMQGTIDTDEKYEARRPILAERVWERMRENDSRNCRSCHTQEAMDLQAQSQSAQEEHQQMGDKTCIDCHQGVAHARPELEKQREEAGFTL